MSDVINLSHIVEFISSTPNMTWTIFMGSFFDCEVREFSVQKGGKWFAIRVSRVVDILSKHFLSLQENPIFLCPFSLPEVLVIFALSSCASPYSSGSEKLQT